MTKYKLGWEIGRKTALHEVDTFERELDVEDDDMVTGYNDGFSKECARLHKDPEVVLVSVQKMVDYEEGAKFVRCKKASLVRYVTRGLLGPDVYVGKKAYFTKETLVKFRREHPVKVGRRKTMTRSEVVERLGALLRESRR